MSILISGAKGYLSKVMRRKNNGGRLHRTAEESQQGRIRKKLLSKSTWFKEKKRMEDKNKNNNKNYEGRDNHGSTGNKGAEDRTLRTRSVLFVEQTPMGALASKIREQLQH